MNSLLELLEQFSNDKSFVPIEDYENLFGIQIFKSGRKHIKEEHVYYCYTPNDFDYSVYKNFVSEVRRFERNNGWEFRKNYNLLRCEIYSNGLYLYQLNGGGDVRYNFTRVTRVKWLKEHE